MKNQIHTNFMPSDDFFGVSPELSQALTSFYLSKKNLRFHIDGIKIKRKAISLLPYFYCFLAPLIFPSISLAGESKAYLRNDVLTSETRLRENDNILNNDYSMLKVTSDRNQTKSSQQGQNYKILIATGVTFDFHDEPKTQVFQFQESGESLDSFISAIYEHGVSLDSVPLNRLKRQVQMVKNLFLNDCRNQLKHYSSEPTRYVFPEIDREIKEGSSGLCQIDKRGNFIRMIEQESLITLLGGNFVKAHAVKSQIATIQKTERLLDQLDDGISLNCLKSSLTEISNFLGRRAKIKPTTNVFVGAVQIYSPPLPIFKANLAGQINFSSQEVFVGVGKVFFKPLYNIYLWDTKFGAILGFDCSCGFNFLKNEYSGLRAKSFVGLGVKL